MSQKEVSYFKVIVRNGIGKLILEVPLLLPYLLEELGIEPVGDLDFTFMPLL